jgi:hypothetical protein
MHSDLQCQSRHLELQEGVAVALAAMQIIDIPQDAFQQTQKHTMKLAERFCSVIPTLDRLCYSISKRSPRRVKIPLHSIQWQYQAASSS